MSTVTVTAFIEAQAVDVWRLLTDLPARARWLSAVGAVEVLTTGDFGTGTAWRETRVRPDGGEQPEEFLVVEAVPAERLVLSSRGTDVDYQITWTLRTVERRGRGCTGVTVEQEAVPTAAYGRVLALILGGLAARAVEGALRRDLADLAVAAAPTTSAEAA
ncbi:Polyketide cyclase / dehydrase and lipid transport [Micromonospora rhizosphaerae]|uniref:Polyketide cyclase / dehydrase and lipid transport n=1 Tax=Micromonospora rhizosphaerae TaxID=568872 RepID=A0A1C6RBV6_9ACTN|nr:SRPBCC family protein [Micromonospora rhizosphaerae]SCL14557.1 Polyketide cyclase / dehydrase and lipid transport [Micromonospora rhizosphaerae]